MKNEKLKIAIDLDDTVWDFQSVFFKFWNEKFGTSYNIKNLSVYPLEDLFKISHSELEDFLDEFELYSDFKKLPIIEGARKAIKKLKESHEIFFITARPPKRRASTEECFTYHFGELDKIYFLGEPKFLKFKTKGELCNFFGADILIDDNIENLKSCSTFTIEPFLFNHYWNQNNSDKRIKRVNNWKEVLEVIQKR